MASNSTTQITNDPCSIQGQQDIYGLGIRVGIYLQWYSLVIAYFYIPYEFTGIMILNYGFSIAVSIALLVHRKEIYAHEVYLVMMLLCVTFIIYPIELIDHALYVAINRGVEPGKEEGLRGYGGGFGSLYPGNPDLPLQSQQLERQQAYMAGAGGRGTGRSSSGSRDGGGDAAGSCAALAYRQDAEVERRYDSRRDPSATGNAAEKGENPNRYNRIAMLGDWVQLFASLFIIAAIGWGYFRGPKTARKATGCEPKLLKTPYLTGGYATMLKVTYTMLVVFAGAMILLRIVLRNSINGADWILAHKYPRDRPSGKEAREELERYKRAFMPQQMGRVGYQSHVGVGESSAGVLAAFYERIFVEHVNLPSLRRFAVSNAAVTTPLRSPIIIKGGITTRFVSTVLIGILLAFIIAYVETAIYQNRIEGMGSVNTAGQLIAMIVGIIGFLTIIYRRLKHDRNRHKHGERNRHFFLKYSEFMGRDLPGSRKPLGERCKHAIRRVMYGKQGAELREGLKEKQPEEPRQEELEQGQVVLERYGQVEQEPVQEKIEYAQGGLDPDRGTESGNMGDETQRYTDGGREAEEYVRGSEEVAYGQGSGAGGRS